MESPSQESKGKYLAGRTTVVKENGDGGFFRTILELDRGAVVVEKRISITCQPMKLIIVRRPALRDEVVCLRVRRERQSTNFGEITTKRI